MAPNPIPTWHKGILYRSRLEARWAVYFGKLEIKAEYETQGFVSEGEPYLPDFAVFGALGTLWLEIKPTWEADPGGVARWRRFARNRPQPSRTALLAGLPAEEMKILVIGGDDSLGDLRNASWEDDGQQWRPCPSGEHFDLAFPGMFRARFAADGCEDKFGGLGEDKVRDAITAARNARFTKPDAGTGA